MFAFTLQVAKSIEVCRWGSPRTKTQLGRQGGADKATGVISGCNFHLVRDGCSRLPRATSMCMYHVCIMYAYCSVYT